MIFIWGNRCRSVTGTHAVDKKLQVKEEEMQSMSTNRYEEAYEKIRLAREAVAAGNTALALSYIEEALHAVKSMRRDKMPYAAQARTRLKSSAWSMRFIWSVRRS